MRNVPIFSDVSCHQEETLMLTLDIVQCGRPLVTLRSTSYMHAMYGSSKSENQISHLIFLSMIKFHIRITTT